MCFIIRQFVIFQAADGHARRVCQEATALVDWATSFRASSPVRLPLSGAVPAGQWVVSFRDRFMKPGRNVLSGHDASEGALYVLLHAVLAAHPEAPAFCAVDNADHALNPRLARELFRCLCQWYTGTTVPRQVILTTQNPLTLDGLPLEDDRVRLFAVSRTDQGHTTVRRILLDDKMKAMVDKGWTLSRLWVMGHLGGVPNV